NATTPRHVAAVMLNQATNRRTAAPVEVLANLADRGALYDPHARRLIGCRFKATVDDIAQVLGDGPACPVVQSVEPRPFPICSVVHHHPVYDDPVNDREEAHPGRLLRLI